ncbi:hypothetical protein HDU79_000783 [Rhizoclosmatium sp. JEL0117]|nr:hypothetical protein HDU79_000783 [Rhizoclosmatium sp. JEL0117]
MSKTTTDAIPLDPLPPGSSSPRTVDSEPLRPGDNDSDTPWPDFQSDQTRALSLTAYANRTDSLHHFRHSDEDDLENDDNEFSHTNTSRYDPMDTSADTDSESDNSTTSDSSTATLDSDATIDDILFTGDRLTLVPPVSLDPRMDLESGMYVEGQVVHGFVSVNGCLVFNVDSNGRSRPLTGDLNDTENLGKYD